MILHERTNGIPDLLALQINTKHKQKLEFDLIDGDYQIQR